MRVVPAVSLDWDCRAAGSAAGRWRIPVAVPAEDSAGTSAAPEAAWTLRACSLEHKAAP